MSSAAGRLEREFCARAFIRAAQYLANMLSNADVLAETRDLVRSAFLADLVCQFQCGSGEPSCSDCNLEAAGRAALRGAVARVVETGLVEIEVLAGPMACAAFPVTVRGRTEAALVIGYAGESTLPPHALEPLLGVVGLVGATLQRQRADRELVTLAEERTARAFAEASERRTGLLAEASKALFASFDNDAALSRLAGLLVPRWADWCVVELHDDTDGGPARLVAAIHDDPTKAEALRDPGTRPKPDRVVPIVVREELFGRIALGVAREPLRHADHALLEEIGRRAGASVENARLYRQAHEAIGIRDQFLAIASHELKTPLSALMLVTETLQRLLERGPVDLATIQAKLAVIDRQTARLGHLVNDLLDVTRIQAGRLHVDVEPVDLGWVLRDVVERHRQEATRAGCEIDLAIAGSIVGAWDLGRVDQIVSNLLSNALKYGAGKPISLAAESSGDTARLQVEDGGIGIDPKDHARIFHRFERADGSRGIAGMGLGLWITREIVARLGGTIRVESRLGEGARFTVELPLRIANAAQSRDAG